MNKINAVLVNVKQNFTTEEQLQARSNIDAQVSMKASGSITLSQDDDSATISMPAEPFDIEYPFKLTVSESSAKLGIDLSNYMSISTYNGLLDGVTAGKNVTIGDDFSVNKTDTTYTADEDSGISLTGNVFSLKTASDTQLGGVIVGDNLSVDSDGVLTSTCKLFGLESGTSSVKNTEYDVARLFSNSLPTVSKDSDTFKINAGINITRTETTSVSLISSINSQSSSVHDLSVHVVYSSATVGNDSDNECRFIYLNNGTPTTSNITLGGEGTILYLNNGQLTLSEKNLGGEQVPVYCNEDNDIVKWSGIIGSPLNHLKKTSDGSFSSATPKYFYGFATSLVRRYYHYIDSEDNAVNSYTSDGKFSETAIKEAMSAGTTNFVFNYQSNNFWTSTNRGSELLYVPVRYMIPGVKYTYSYNRSNIRNYTGDGDGDGFYEKENFFGFDFDLSDVKSSSDTVAAYYYGFISGIVKISASTQYGKMYSPFYVQTCDNGWSDCALISPCFHEYNPSADGKKANFEYPLGFPSITGSTDQFTSPVLVLHDKSYPHLYWRVLVGNGYSSTSSYCFDTRVGPMHSLTFMRGHDIDGVPALYALSYN